MEQEITYKKCSKCGEEKPLTSEYFYTDKRKTDNLTSACKECNRKSYNPIKRREKYEKNREKVLKYSKEYYKNNREKRIKDNVIYNKKRLENDEFFNFYNKIRLSITGSFQRKDWTKKSRTYDYLKCDWETFKKHIESQFTDGMSWDNQGEWHYDHYYPVSLAQTEEDMYIFNHYTNFQPLWAKDNISKSNKVPDGFEEWYEMMKKKVL